MINIDNPARLGSRLLAILYDSLIVFFLIFIITLILQQVIIQFEMVTLEQVQISKDTTASTIPGDSFAVTALRSLWFFLPLFYFGHYWTKRGQTPGMKVWKVIAINQNGSLMSWTQAVMRYVFALFGLGLLWMIFNKERLPLQDQVSKTYLTKIKNS